MVWPADLEHVSESDLAHSWRSLGQSGAGEVCFTLGDMVPQGSILKSNKAPACLRGERPQSIGGDSICHGPSVKP
ncbi:hypothetical protein PBY51_009499 [Eleginops maclovinus]|uniref:Uncharacterized protein n=1 Tax=Eleginops maclovinus TaxID=56733 RepID=A0AAN7XU70_ELEMC|nr:hypothetical protein PBY51_009499 [Eleginops maclovinus]